MPPLERLSPSNQPSSYMAVLEEQVLSGKGHAEPHSRIDLREVAVHARRDLVFKMNPLSDTPQMELNRAAPEHEARSRDLDWVEMFTAWCSCQGTSYLERPAKKAAVASNGASTNIMYPVARYPDRLNSPQMVEQRRKSLEKQLMFRPVLE